MISNSVQQPNQNGRLRWPMIDIMDTSILQKLALSYSSTYSS